MQIGIDVCSWSNRRGFGRFTRELTTEIIEQFGNDHEFVLVADRETIEQNTFPTNATLTPLSKTVRNNSATTGNAYRSPFDLIDLGRRVARLKLDVFLFPTASTYFPILSRVPVVLCLHDAMTEIDPESHFASKQARLFWTIKIWCALKQAKKIVSPSMAARKQIAAAWKVPFEQIEQIDEGPAEHFSPTSSPESNKICRERFSLPEKTPIVLYVGGISPHKNLGGLVKSMSQINCPWHCVIVGDEANDGYLNCHDSVRKTIRECSVEDCVTLTGYVSDEDLLLLYQTATILVLPSFNEGFGLPAIEAMATGLPIAVSNRGSLPEIVADAGLFFDPENHSEMSQVIESLLTNEKLRNEFATLGLKRAKTYSWQRGASQMMNILQNVAT